MNKTNEKKVLIFSTIAVVLLIIVAVGATYAFFTAQGGSTANTNVNVQTNTTVEETAEMILTITDPDGTELQTLGSYEYTTVEEVSGFDITTANGLITIADNYEISATETPTTQEWNVTVTFVNLDSDQEENTNKTFEATVIIQEEAYAEEVTTLGNFAEYITTQLYTGTDGENGLYYHDADLANGAQDNSYRYSGANPNNYVCFGSTENLCPADNLYRIIGVFNNQVKLIKSTSYGNHVWEQDYDTQGNTWDTSTKPDIYTTLNETYYNTIPAEWQNLIAESTWQVGGMALNTTNTTKQYYDVEVGTGQIGYEEIMKIGLMYVLDYGYGASPENWALSLGLDSSNYGTDNWLYLGSTEWLISRRSGTTTDAFSVVNNGYVNSSTVRNNYLVVRPSFYLASTVEISRGTGSSTDPFILSLG